MSKSLKQRESELAVIAKDYAYTKKRLEEIEISHTRYIDLEEKENKLMMIHNHYEKRKWLKLLRDAVARHKVPTLITLPTS